MTANNARKQNETPRLLDLTGAEKMNLMTLTSIHRGTSVEFIEEVYPRCEEALLFIKDNAPEGPKVFHPSVEVALVVHELGWGYWTGSTGGGKVVLRNKDLTWTMTMDRAIFEDGHGNMRSYRKAILHDPKHVMRVRMGWELVDSRVYRHHSAYNAPLLPAPAIQWLIDLLSGKENNSPGLELRATDFADARDALVVSKVSDFAGVLDEWLYAEKSINARYTDALAAAEYWHGMIAMLRGKEIIGDPVRFGRMFLTLLLVMSRHVDDRLQRKLFTQLRKRMNCMANPEMGQTPRSVYSFGQEIFEAVDKVHSARASRMLTEA